MSLLLEIGKEKTPIHGAIAKCFQNRECTQCGACCIYITDQEVPNGRTVRELRATGQERVNALVMGFPKTKALDCLHLVKRTNGTKFCGVHDLKTHQSVLTTDILKKCRHWCGSKAKLTTTKRFGYREESLASSEQDELLEGIAENILLPPSVERFATLESDFKMGLFRGIEKRIKKKIKIMAQRMEKGKGLTNVSGEYILADWIMNRYFVLGIVPNLDLFRTFGIDMILHDRYKKNRLTFWFYFGRYSLAQEYQPFFAQFGNKPEPKLNKR